MAEYLEVIKAEYTFMATTAPGVKSTPLIVRVNLPFHTSAECPCPSRVSNSYASSLMPRRRGRPHAFVVAGGVAVVNTRGSR